MSEEDGKEIVSINNNDLFNNSNFDIDNIPWIISKYVFENNQEHGYKLHKGDIFKLGKYILRVREIGIEDDKKHFFFENKNTQKYIKNRSISVNNVSQMPLNQQGENYCSALNLNNIINVKRKDENNKEINQKNQNHEVENGSNNNENNIQINKNEYEDNNKENNNSNNNSHKNKFLSIKSNNEIKNNSQKVISIYYSNPSANNNSQSNHYNEIVSNNGSNNGSNNNKNHYLINIINSSSNDNNNNCLDDSKNKINNNRLGFHTFHNNSIIYSSGKNMSNLHNSIKIIENENENENSKKNFNVNISSSSNRQIFKNSIKALKSTASFKKSKLTDIIPKKQLKNSISMTEKNNKPICRICLSEEYEENNPLIHPCNCDGTMKYIHLQCLRLLIQSKIKKTETDSCKVFTFKTLECEICKMVFPEKVKIKGTVFAIIDLEKPDKDYIILDGLIKEAPEEKSIFIVHFKNKKEIKIGRATDANIRLSDISVSRAHAVISQYNDHFYLHDTNSKFGTLISAGNKFCILCNKPFSIQKGNILFEFLMKKTFCAFLRCYRPSVVFYKTYNDFLDESFLYKNHYKGEDLLIPEKTKSVSNYSSNIIIKSNIILAKSSKDIDFFDNSENIRNNNESKYINKKKSNIIQSKEDNKNSSILSNNNSNENNSKNYNSKGNNSKNSNNIDDNNNNQQFFFDSFMVNKGNNNDGNYNSICINKTQEKSNILQKNDYMKQESKLSISLNKNGNENSLLFNNNIISNDI